MWKSATLMLGVLGAAAGEEKGNRTATALRGAPRLPPAGPVARRAKRQASLCTERVVRETCSDFQAGEDDGGALDGRVSRQMITDEFAAGAGASDALWGALGLGSNASVACMDLCRAAVEYVGRLTQLPPSHDKACYRAASGGVACDLDVSLPALQEIRFAGDLPSHQGDDRSRGRPKRTRRPPGGGARKANGTRRATAEGMAPHTVHALVERVANAFRVYPAPGLVAPPTSTVAMESKPACATSVWRVVQKSKVWVTSAISKVQRRETRQHMQRWFGATAAATRTEVLRVLNSIEAVLADFSFVILPEHPETCDGATYAFVVPDGSDHCDEAELQTVECATDAAGRRVVYLCDLYCASSENVQIETLAHESSHHFPAATDDVPPEPYGREKCLDMARSRPQAALRNADSYCFYVVDVVLGLGDRGAMHPSSAGGDCVSAPCSCESDELRVNENGCCYCAAKCPSAASGDCDESPCQCGPGQRRADAGGCFYCEDA